MQPNKDPDYPLQPPAGRSGRPETARQSYSIAAVNEFDDAPKHPTQAVRKALALPEHIPVVAVDARDRNSAKAALIAVTEYSLTTMSALPG